MNRKHVALISLVIALAAVAGLFGVLRTTSLAATGSAGATDGLVQARTRQLDAVERRLRAQVARLDATTVTTSSRRSAATARTPVGAAASTDAAEKVVYVRPAPIVRTVHRGHGSEPGEAAEHAREHGSVDHGGSDD